MWKDAEKRRAYDREYKRKQRATNSEPLRKAMRKWAAEHREELAERQKAYLTANRDAVNARQRARYAANREACKAKMRADYEANKEARRTYAVDRRANNPEIAAAHCEAERKRREERHEEINARRRERNANDPIPHRLQQHRRRVQKANAKGRGMTLDRWRAILEANDHRCSYCLRKCDNLEPDHIIALVRGGEDSPENITPACETCNTSKNDKSLLGIFSTRLLVGQRMGNHFKE